MQRFQAPAGWRPEHEVPSCERGDFAASRDPDLESGIDYVGPYDILADGIGEACRRHALALDAAGIPVFLYSNAGRGRPAYHTLPQAVRKRLDPLTECRYKTPLLRIVHTVMDRIALYQTVFPRTRITLPTEELRRLRQTTVITTVHERLAPDQEMKDIAKLANLVGEVWVPSTRNRDVLVSAGVHAHKVHVVPHPYDIEDVPLFDEARRRSPGWQQDMFVFFTVGKWEPRKGGHELIGAFLSAFRPNEGVLLVVKTSEFGVWREYPRDPAASLRAWLSEPAVQANGWDSDAATRAVLPIQGVIPRHDLIQMHCQADCYVCSSRSEGFCLPVLDAKLAGKRMVYTPCGGPEDLSSPDDIRVPCTSLVEVHPQYGWGDARWSGFSVQQLAASMREAFEARGRPPSSVSLERFSPASVGAAMRARIDEILTRGMCGA